jgi:hypothetical protein
LAGDSRGFSPPVGGQSTLEPGGEPGIQMMKKNLNKPAKSEKRMEDLLKEAQEYEESLIQEWHIVDFLKISGLRLSPKAIRDVWNCVNRSQKFGHFLDERPTTKETRKKLKEIRIAAENLKDSLASVKSPWIFLRADLRGNGIKLSNEIIRATEAEPPKAFRPRIGRKKVHSVKMLLSQLIPIIEADTKRLFVEYEGETYEGKKGTLVQMQPFLRLTRRRRE